MWCLSCTNKSGNRPTVFSNIDEYQLKKEREKYGKDILQPMKDGKVNKDFVQAYGTGHYKKEMKLNKEQFYKLMP